MEKVEIGKRQTYKGQKRGDSRMFFETKRKSGIDHW